MMRRIMGLLSIASLLVSATYLHAQGYPNQPISLVLPYAPGIRVTSLAGQWPRSWRRCSKSPLFR